MRLAAQPAREWTEALITARVPTGIVNDVGAAFEFARSLGLGPVVGVPRGDGTEVPLTRNPLELTRTPPTYRSGPPGLPET